MQTITPFLWFDNQAEEAMNLYTSIFPGSRVVSVTRYGEAGPGPKGSVMTASFDIAGQRFTALNGGPQFVFTPAVSFVIECDSQEEIDRYWAALSEGGDPAAQQCGWLKDRFGLSWQVVPRVLPELLQGEGGARVMQSLMGMKKLDLGALRAARG